MPKAGHFVPNEVYDNYWTSWNFLNDYISQQSLVCHAADGNCQVTTTKCTYMNNCSSHGTCQTNGTCACENGWKGADCATPTIELVDGDFKVLQSYGPKYYSFTKNDAVSSILILNSELDMDVFISAGNTTYPTQFSHDVAILKTKKVTLDSNDIHFLQQADGYSVTTFAVSMDEAANTYFNNTMTAWYGERATELNQVQNTVGSIMDASYALINTSDLKMRSVF